MTALCVNNNPVPLMYKRRKSVSRNFLPTSKDSGLIFSLGMVTFKAYRRRVAQQANIPSPLCVATLTIYKSIVLVEFNYHTKPRHAYPAKSQVQTPNMKCTITLTTEGHVRSRIQPTYVHVAMLGGVLHLVFFKPMYVAGLERLEKFQELLVSYTHVHVHVHACTCMYSSTVYGLWLSNSHYVCWDVYGLSYLNSLTFFLVLV